MDTTAKDLPSPLPLLRLMPMPPLDTDTAMATVMDTAMADMVTMDMAAMDTTDTTARGKLKLLLLLSPLPMPLLDTDTTAMVTDYRQVRRELQDWLRSVAGQAWHHLRQHDD